MLESLRIEGRRLNQFEVFTTTGGPRLQPMRVEPDMYIKSKLGIHPLSSVFHGGRHPVVTPIVMVVLKERGPMSTSFKLEFMSKHKSPLESNFFYKMFGYASGQSNSHRWLPRLVRPV